MAHNRLKRSIDRSPNITHKLHGAQKFNLCLNRLLLLLERKFVNITVVVYIFFLVLNSLMLPYKLRQNRFYLVAFCVYSTKLT